MANTRFENALKRIPQNIPPIWMMRQAGRYHNHYQNLRKDYTFEQLCKEPDLAAEVAMGPIQDFDFDVAILFSDILYPLEALGMGLSYGDGGPQFEYLLDAGNIKNLKSKDEALSQLEFQRRAVEATRKRLPSEKSLIGFVGGIWTLFTFAVEGTHKGSLVKTKQALPLFQKFSETMLPLIEANIAMQIEGGAEVVMVFDTAAGDLDPFLYKEILVPQIEYLVQRFPKRIGYYAKNITHAHLRNEIFQDEQLAGIGIDHRFDLPELLKRRRTGFVQGNFDQLMLCMEPEEFRRHFEKYSARLLDLSPEERAGWVCALGHGVVPWAKEENVKYFVDTIREKFQ